MMTKHQTCHKLLNQLCPLLRVEMQYNKKKKLKGNNKILLFINF
jgi:hypothetical protein